MATTRHREAASDRRRVGRDRRLGRGALALLRRGRRAGREGGRGRGAARRRRGRGGDAGAAAGAQAGRDPRPRRRPPRPPPRGGRADDLGGGRQAAKAARVEASRAMSTFTFAAVEARKLAGEMVPMDASQAGAGKLALHAAAADRRRRRDLARSTSRSTSSRTRSRRRSRRAARSCSSPRRRRRSRRSCSPSSMTEAGLPPGWLNVLVGPASEIGDVLVEDERVRAITFTGSGDVGWKLAERAPRKRVKLELGNATPVIVEADADLEDVATRLAANAFSFAGQSCISVQRIYVQRAAYDELVSPLRPEGRGARRRRPRGRGDRRRPADRPRRARARARVDRGGARGRRRDPDRRRARSRREPSCCGRP